MILNKKTAGAVIFTILILLLFFSRTIYTYNMPEVTGTRPRRGGLSKLEISSGIASWAENETLYAVSAGLVGQVFVREGDYVEKGQVLFEMDFDITAAGRRLSEAENNILRLETDIRNLNLRLGYIKEALAADNDEDEGSLTLTGQAGIIALELSRARTVLQNTQFAFELGSQSRNDLVNAQNNLMALLFKYEAEAEELEHSILLRQLDLANLRLSRETIRELLLDYRSNAFARAPVEGTILSLAAERGKFFPENSFLVSIGIGNEFIVECEISLDNNFVNPGDSCELINANHVLSGIVRRVRPSVNGKTITISIVSAEVNDGETFDVIFERTTASSYIVVPNNAIYQDNDGYFIYQIKRRRGIMGEEYYLERLGIFIGDSDHQNTIVVRGITFLDPIVSVSNKALSPGITVYLKNAEEFFEN